MVSLSPKELIFSSPLCEIQSNLRHYLSNYTLVTIVCMFLIFYTRPLSALGAAAIIKLWEVHHAYTSLPTYKPFSNKARVGHRVACSLFFSLSFFEQKFFFKKKKQRCGGDFIIAGYASASSNFHLGYSLFVKTNNLGSSRYRDSHSSYLLSCNL